MISLYNDRNRTCQGITSIISKYCSASDIMGYHDSREIPNYWEYAKEFVLQDHLFESVSSWSLPSHLFMVSAWSGTCKDSNPMSCNNSVNPKFLISNNVIYNQSWKINMTQPNYAWTDITYLLYKNNVSWAFYYDEDIKDRNDLSWFTWVSPLPWFQVVHDDKQLNNIQP